MEAGREDRGKREEREVGRSGKGAAKENKGDLGRKTDAKALFPVSDSWSSAYSGLIPHHTAPWQGRGAGGLWRKSQPDQGTYLGLLKPDSPARR